MTSIGLMIASSVVKVVRNRFVTWSHKRPDGSGFSVCRASAGLSRSYGAVLACIWNTICGVTLGGAWLPQLVRM